MKKKAIAALLLSMALILAPVSGQMSFTANAAAVEGAGVTGAAASAESDEEYTYQPPDVNYKFSYTIDDKGIVLTKCSGTSESGMNVPGEIDGKTVYGIGDNCFSMSNVSINGQLILPNSITTIGDRAFYKQKNLTGSLTLPSSLQRIGKEAFAYCSGFTGGLELPSMVNYIGFQAFISCSGFEGGLTLRSPMEIHGSAFEVCSGLNGEVQLAEGLNWEQISMPDGNIFLGSGLTLPEGVVFKYSPSDAEGVNYSLHYTVDQQGVVICGFEGSSEVGLNIPGEIEGNPVYSIGSSAFGYVGDKLKGELTLPESLKIIGLRAFENCSGLTGELKLPSGLETLERYAFSNCSGFTGELNLPSGLTRVEWYAFRDCSGFTGELKLPSSLEYLGEQAFMNCSGFTGELKLPSSLEYLGGQAFENCSGFTGSLELPDGVEYLQFRTFKGCSGLDGTLKLPSSVNWIEEYVFQDCKNLTGTVVLPRSLQRIQRGVFSGCENLDSEVRLEEGLDWSKVTKLGDPFEGSNLRVVEDPIPTPDPSGDPGEGTPGPSGDPGEGTPGPSGDPGEGTPDPSGDPGEGTPSPSGAPDEGTPGPSGAPGEGTPSPSGTPGEGTPSPSGAPDEGTPGPSGAPDEGTPGPSSTPGEGTPGPSSTPGEGTPGPSGDPGEGTPSPSGAPGEGTPSPTGAPGESTPGPEDPGEVTPSPTDAPSGPDTGSSGSSSNAAAVTASDGSEVASTLPIRNALGFAAAVTTPVGSAAASAGLEEGQIIIPTFDKVYGEAAWQAIEEAAKAAGLQVAYSFDLTLKVENGNGTPAGTVTKLDSPMVFVITAPEDVDRNAYNFAVVRIHEGKVTILPDLDSDPATITFATDSFSLYSVVYEEKGKAAGAKVKDNVPKTGDTVPAAVPFSAAVGVLALAVSGVAYGKKKNYGRNRF